MTPIPDLRPHTGWRAVPIEPAADPLVRVADFDVRIHDHPRYAQWGVPDALPHSWVREGVAERLARAAASLPPDRSLVVWDGFRPLSVQAALYDDWEGRLRRAHPDWTEEAIGNEAARFVTPPSDDPAAPPPHLTGGAVDLTLGDADGRPLDMGTDFDAFVDEAHAQALEGRPGPARENRRMLFWAMSEAGFTAYAEEWWHFDYGDQFWALISGKPARYGPAGLPSQAREPLEDRGRPGP